MYARTYLIMFFAALFPDQLQKTSVEEKAYRRYFAGTECKIELSFLCTMCC